MLTSGQLAMRFFMPSFLAIVFLVHSYSGFYIFVSSEGFYSHMISLKTINFQISLFES